MLRVLLFLVPLALAIYALVDCISSDDEDVRHLPKLLWIALIVLAPLLGALAWILVGRRRRTPSGGRGSVQWVAPDDNPEFLRSLGDGARRDDDEARRAESAQDRELLENWEEDLRRREERLKDSSPNDSDDDNPAGGPDRP
ncbi:PLD nuclease N-terminal domain-containing protein [Streptomyces sp. RFCAC02]|uniref:PLD nuclease N-terminal domain-containing protein n=1 Tax=Streptomyces sp. RFCAC02 TaxID=2499143 RepID=UPI0010201FAC|nr:PLD nuclease N-terminal domain-containing protein [Streptomyces sp. RFCAC02]